jgi:hypothetical protein
MDDAHHDERQTVCFFDLIARPVLNFAKMSFPGKGKTGLNNGDLLRRLVGGF